MCFTKPHAPTLNPSTQLMRGELVEKMTDEQVARLTALEAKKEKAFRLEDTQRQLRSAPAP